MIDKLKEIVKKVSPETDIDTISEKTRFVDDLEFDSISMMMLSLEVEEAFGFRFEETVRFQTVGDVVKYLEAMKK